ncbi:hypothetical protein [Caldifermentibacillus hisashii]|uniref:hypothetical protein n=1 Tax=Caldifermentibacillus hisashii TaxID=996558 RepID=UPI0030E85C07
MKTGDRVMSLPVIQEIVPSGSLGTVQEVYSDGWGVVKFDDGIRLLIKLNKNFVVVKE